MQRLTEEIDRLVMACDRLHERREAAARDEQDFLERTRLLVEELIEAPPASRAEGERLRRELRARFARTHEALMPEPLPQTLFDRLRALVVDLRHG